MKVEIDKSIIQNKVGVAITIDDMNGLPGRLGTLAGWPAPALDLAKIFQSLLYLYVPSSKFTLCVVLFLIGN